MTFLGKVFRRDDMPEAQGFDPLPAGWYTAQVTKAELRNTKSGTGQYIAVRYDITGPTHAGRVVFGNINIVNASAEAERIGQQQLGALLDCIGLDAVEDTDELVGHAVRIKLSVRDAADGYEAQNEVKGFKGIDDDTPGIVAPSAAPSRATRSAAAAAPVARQAPAAAPAPAAGAAPRKAPPWATKR